jgi:hypothetical protein
MFNSSVQVGKYLKLALKTEKTTKDSVHIEYITISFNKIFNKTWYKSFP